MRLNKFLSLCGISSRRKADDLIKSGKIKVNGKVQTELGLNINEEKDDILYDGKKISIKDNFLYIKLNKPKGYICSNKDEKGRKTIFELLPNDKKLFSVGRLDYNTEGLILITNDGDFANKIIHPSYEIEKEYIVTIKGKILESEMAVLRAGVVEKDGKKLPKSKVKLLNFENNISRLSIVIDQGKNRQIRRMFDAIGRTIILLKRIRIGNIRLGGVQRGKFKELTDRELSYFI